MPYHPSMQTGNRSYNRGWQTKNAQLLSPESHSRHIVFQLLRFRSIHQFGTRHPPNRCNRLGARR